MTPIVYDNLEVSDNVKSVLKMHPGFMINGRIDLTAIEVEIEKGITKARYALMNKDDKTCEENAVDSNESNDECQVFNAEEKTANYSNLRATEIPTVQRLYPPKPASINQELCMQNMREKLLKIVLKFQEKRCNKNGWLNKRNISQSETEGIK